MNTFHSENLARLHDELKSTGESRMAIIGNVYALDYLGTLYLGRRHDDGCDFNTIVPAASDDVRPGFEKSLADWFDHKLTLIVDQAMLTKIEEVFANDAGVDGQFADREPGWYVISSYDGFIYSGVHEDEAAALSAIENDPEQAGGVPYLYSPSPKPSM